MAADKARHARGLAGRALPSLVLATVALASCSGTPERPTAETEADGALARHVYLALNADPLYYFRHVSVRADDGVVALSGYVWSPDALYRARQVARDVPGVRRVVTTNLEMELEGRGNGVSR